MHKKFFVATMGCQMNEYNSDTLIQLLLNAGYTATDDPALADLVMINTCSVRNKAEQKAYSLIGRMAILKRKKKGLVLGLMGCIAQQEGAGLIQRFPALDLILGPREIDRIGPYLERIQKQREKIVAIEIAKPPSASLNRKGYFDGRIKAHVTIMEGCNNFCSYCIVPYVRGREISRPHQEILSEIKTLIPQGVKEVTLLGQNVNSYLDESGSRLDFPGLLVKLEEIPGLLRVRFTTSHPKDLSDALIGCFKNLKNLCPHIHLPVQAGSNRILKQMNRGYTREKLFDLIRRLRETRPDMAITSDMIVGFPGETSEDFQMTLDLIQQIEFDNLFSFKYSDRKGTKAAEMTDKISDTEKSSRLALLQDLQKQITLKKNKTLEGQVTEVLVDGFSKKGGQLSGRNPQNKLINFNSKNGKLGDLIKVNIKHAFINSILGVSMD